MSRAGASLELGSCGAGLAELQCGSFVVPEDPSEPEGRSVSLQIVVAPATARTPAADPVFFLAGGPGQGAADLAHHILPQFEPFRRNRDLVFVDLRGTGGSAPLDCDLGDLGDLAKVLAEDPDYAKLDACAASYEADLDHYSTEQQIADLDAVREALGYEQINLYGISYGTRAGQVYMRRHPQRIRSAVFDAVVPADVALYATVPASAEQALLRVLADCRAQAECDAAFPQLERKLEAVLADLDNPKVLREITHPRTGVVERLEVPRAAFESVLLTSLYAEGYTALLPLIIDRAHAGDFGPFVTLALSSAAQQDSISLGLHYTIACAEGYEYAPPEELRSAAEDLRFFSASTLEVFGQVCARWPHPTPAPEHWEPLTSDTPTLMFSGRYDPVTPVALAEHLEASLSNGRSVVLETGHHGAWKLGCVPELMAEFFDTLDAQALDLGCLDALEHAPFFLSAAGPRPAPSYQPTPQFVSGDRP